MTEKMNGTSLNISAENRDRLKALFPTVFTETVNDKGEIVESVDFEKLKAELGTFTDLFENRRERYGMDWPGKKDALRLIQTPSAATLKPCREESVNFDTTENLFIEGDNLEVLKLLQKSYYGKVKMICIDPPYNTGKEFIYPDNYSESLETYLEYAGLIDGDGKKFSTNTANEGRFHTKWLNMMYPRLYLARNLLRDDGVIFIHIDDNEVSNLRKLCDEIFGEENFVESIIWKRRATPPNDRIIGKNHEYILVYAKNIEVLNLYLQPRDEKSKQRYSNPDNDPKGPWVASDLSANGKGDRLVESCIFPIKNPNNQKEYLPPENKCWLYNKSKIYQFIEENRIGFRTQTGSPFLKRYLSEVRDGVTLPTIIDDGGFSQDSAREIKELFNNDIFEFPKPTTLLSKLINCGLADSDIILDFFSGSCTTAHAVLDQNKQDGGNRKFIMVQLPEPCAEDSEAFKAGYKTIADIGKERIRRVIKKLDAEEAGKLALKNPVKQDRGFKVLKLNKSNFRQWQSFASEAKPEHLIKQLSFHIDHIGHKATKEDLLYEILIKAGFKPTEKVEVMELKDGKLSRRDAEPQRKETGRSMVTEKGSIEKATLSSFDSSAATSASPRETLFSIADGALLICIADAVTKELINAVAEAEPMQFICLDKAFGGNDQLKANAVQTFNTHNMDKEKHNQIIFRTV